MVCCRLEAVEIREQVSLAEYTTFGVGGKARYFCEAVSEEDVAEAVGWAKERRLPLFVLGGGSNLLVPDVGYGGLAMLMGNRGVDYRDGEFGVAAGESWDALVDKSLLADCAGIECLAGIPGSVGGTPVQNVGAYGQEVSETIESVRAFDRMTGTFVELSKAECRFRYRESLFNTDEPGRYIVTRVHFRLRPGGAPTLKYAELAKRFEGVSPTLTQVAEVVREIRLGKGMLIVPGDGDCRSAGSFFRNPIIGVAVLDGVRAAAGVAELPHWGAGEGLVKLPAAWLLERAGFVKGYGRGPVRISSRHTLALTNRGGARFADVMAMQDEIVAGVFAKFGVRLEREPVVMG